VWRENCRGRKWQELDQWKLKIMSLVGLVLERSDMSVFSLKVRHFCLFIPRAAREFSFVAYMISNAWFGLHELCF
jgi:hypothetical protein